MKKRFYLLFSLPILLLGSCSNINMGFYGKTFSYQNDIFTNLSNVTYRTLNKTRETIIKEEMAKNNVNWEQSGNIDSKGNVTTTFSKHGTYEDVYSSMKEIVTPTFKTNYDGLKLSFSDSKSQKVTIYSALSKEAITYDAKPYGTTLPDDAISLDILQGNLKIGSIYYADGCTCNDGLFSCVEVALNSKKSVFSFKITFINPLSDVGSSINWNCNALIKN